MAEGAARDGAPSRIGRDLSIVVTIYDMAREAPRTLFSLSRRHQRDVASLDYEVIVVDNGSDVPLGRELVESFGDNFVYHYIDDASPSPAPAMNVGAHIASGEWLCLMIDGARMLTPGTLASAMRAIRDEDASMVETMAFHLGPDRRIPGARDGYDRAAEDSALDRVRWPDEPYRLFDISTLSGSCAAGWFAPINESNCLFLRRDTFERLGGYDERFELPGGGLVNLDFYARVLEDSGHRRYRLLGEANFHQMHGGAATSLSPRRLRRKMLRWRLQYLRIRGLRTLRSVERGDPINLYGDSGPEADRWLEISRTLRQPGDAPDRSPKRVIARVLDRGRQRAVRRRPTPPRADPIE